MTKLLLMCLIFIIFFLPTCYNVGDIVLKKLKFNFNKYITIFMGFVIIIAIFQMLYYPAMTLQLSSNYIFIVGLIINLFFLILYFKNIKNVKYVFFDKKMILILFGAFFIFFLYLNVMPHDLWYYDDSFYFPYMYDNANTDKLYSIEPRMGERVDKTNKLYTQQ